MGAFVVGHDYKAGTVGPFVAGAVVEIDDELAAWIGRDSPGALLPYSPPPPAVIPPVKTPAKRAPANRQARPATARTAKKAAPAKKPATKKIEEG